MELAQREYCKFYDRSKRIDAKNLRHCHWLLLEQRMSFKGPMGQQNVSVCHFHVRLEERLKSIGLRHMPLRRVVVLHSLVICHGHTANLLREQLRQRTDGNSLRPELIHRNKLLGLHVRNRKCGRGLGSLQSSAAITAIPAALLAVLTIGTSWCQRGGACREADCHGRQTRWRWN